MEQSEVGVEKWKGTKLRTEEDSQRPRRLTVHDLHDLHSTMDKTTTNGRRTRPQRTIGRDRQVG